MKKNSMLNFFAFILISIFLQVTWADLKNLEYLPVQDGGRIKPYGTLTKETLQYVYGKTTYEGKQGVKHQAVEVVTTWLLVPQFWDQEKIVEIPYQSLKEALGYQGEDLKRKYFSPMELIQNSKTEMLIKDLASRREAKEKLDPFYQAVSRLEGQLNLFHGVKTGEGLRFVPHKERDLWLSVAELEGELREAFGELTRSFIHELPKGSNEPAPAPDAKPPMDMASAVQNFSNLAKAQAPEKYANDRAIQLEVHYNHFHPFRWAYILYILGSILVGVGWFYQDKSKGTAWYRSAMGLTIAAFFLHTYGFGLRVYLTDRPPVSNMYESVVWVSWGAVIFGLIFEMLKKRYFILLAANVVASICMIVADAASVILDNSLQPLQPVLRSQFWLIVHVLTIAISYSALFLALMIGNLGAFFILKGRGEKDPVIVELVHAIYRCMQVGIILLTAGIILGGVWADYSWGRFWGWDPKETWALIALLGYIALLHGRIVGWVKNVGMIIGAIVSFNLVIMAWYGVNYVLGAGLHSYGFGAGGIEWVSLFVAAEVLLGVFTLKKARTMQATPA